MKRAGSDLHRRRDGCRGTEIDLKEEANREAAELLSARNEATAPVTDTPPLDRRQIDALRACAENPTGQRKTAYPSIMPGLAALGLVEERPAHERVKGNETAWFLTRTGRDELARHCRPSAGACGFPDDF